MGSGKAAEDKQYFHAIGEALKGAQEILVVGPAQAKRQLIKPLHSHNPQVGDKVVGVESIDHPTDAQLKGCAV